MAPPSSSKTKSVAQLRKQAAKTTGYDSGDDVISLSDDTDDMTSSDGDQYGPPRPAPPRPSTSNAVASSSKVKLAPIKKMFERPIPKPKPKKPSPTKTPSKPKGTASASSSKPSTPRPPPPPPPPPRTVSSSSGESDSDSDDDSDDDSDEDEMVEIELPEADALAAARAGDEEEHPALALQRQEEEERRAAAGEDADAAPKMYKDGKGGNQALEIQVGREEDGGGRHWKGKGKKKITVPRYSPEDRAAHLNAHKIHIISLLAGSGHRNRLLNGVLLKARLLSLLPPAIPASFNSITKQLQPDAAKRARLFDRALISLVDWFSGEWTTDYRAGIRGRSWDHAASLPSPTSATTPAKDKGKGKAKAEMDVWGGELIRTEKSLQKKALMMSGSRDVGAQLFVSCARSLGLGVRLVCSLQGVGWRMGDGKPKVDKVRSLSDDEPEQVEDAPEEERDPNAPVRWIDRKEGERFPGLGNQLGVTEAEIARGKGSDKKKKKELHPSLMVKQSKRKGKKLGKKKTKIGGKVENSDDPFDPLSPPIFWAEVFSRPDQEWIPIDPIRGFVRRNKDFEPVGEGMRNRMVYVVAFEEDGSARDLTRKYHSDFYKKVPKLRVNATKGTSDWWSDLMKSMGRGYELRRDVIEEAKLTKKVKKPGMPMTIAGFHNHPEFVLERHLKSAEVVYPKVQHSVFRGEPVYKRSNVVECKSEETWAKRGREVMRGEEPMKWVKMRAMTINRRREVEAAKEFNGEELKQALYSLDQTRLFQAPPIKDGYIPKNAYGNIDMFTPTMLPPGAVHLPFKGIAKVAKKLELSYAEAVTGFEYKKQRAIPVVTGVVVAEENKDVLMEAYEIATADAAERELVKLKARVIKRWQKLITDLRIRKKLQVEYGNAAVADGSFQAPGGFDQDDDTTGVREHEFPKAKHITVKVPASQEPNSRRFEGESEAKAEKDDPEPNGNKSKPRPAAVEEESPSSDEEEEEEEAEEPAPKITLNLGKAKPAAAPKSLEEMLAAQQQQQSRPANGRARDEDDSDLSDLSDADADSDAPPARQGKTNEPPLQEPTSASKPSPAAAGIGRITLRRPPSSPVLAPPSSSSRPTRSSTRPKPTPRVVPSATPQGRRTTRASGKVAPSTTSSRKRGRAEIDSDEEEDVDEDDEVTEDFTRGPSARGAQAAGGRSLRSRGKPPVEPKEEEEVIELSD